METHPDPIPTAAEPDRLEAVALEIAAKMVAALTRLAGNGLALARRGMQDLPFVEDLLRRVIYLMALRLDAPAPAPAAIPKRPAASAPSAEMEREPRAPRFRLIEPEQDRDPRRLLTPAECPRVTLMDDTAQPFIPPIQAAPKLPRDGLGALVLRQRWWAGANFQHEEKSISCTKISKMFEIVRFSSDSSDLFYILSD